MQTALEATIKLGAGISVDGYFIGDGTFRYGLAYISKLLGYAENYYRRLLNPQRTKNTSKKLKALKTKGFTAYQITVKASREGIGGTPVAHTVSYKDFCILVEYEAESGNPKALALLTASFRELLRSRTQVAFGLPEDSLERKQLEFQFNYQHYLEDQAELDELKLPGDEIYHPEFNELLGVSPWGLPYFEQENLFAEHL
jgi:hypothetical protein